MARQKDRTEQFCRACGSKIKKEAEICPQCGVRPGTQIETTSLTTFCSVCGESIHDEAAICPNCGSQREGAERDIRNVMENVGECQPSAILGCVFLTFSVLLLINGSVFGFLVFGIIGAILLSQIRDEINFEYPVSTFGKKRTTKKHTVNNTDELCSICYDEVESGIKRFYGKEYVIFGIAANFEKEGENHYCDSCMVKNIELEFTDDAQITTED